VGCPSRDEQIRLQRVIPPDVRFPGVGIKRVIRRTYWAVIVIVSFLACYRTGFFYANTRRKAVSRLGTDMIRLGKSLELIFVEFFFFTLKTLLEEYAMRRVNIVIELRASKRCTLFYRTGMFPIA